MVIAFAATLELRESPVLDQIRAELRSLGAALVLVTDGQVFCFCPEQDLDLYGSDIPTRVGAFDTLRAVYGLARGPARQLSLVLLAGDGRVVARQNVAASDELSALARALRSARREAVTQPFSPSGPESALVSLMGAFTLLGADGSRGPGPEHAPAAAPARKTTRQRRLLDGALREP